MATLTFNADSAEASGVDVTKVGSTFVISGANPVITLDTIDYGAALAGDNSTAAESLSGGVSVGNYIDNTSPAAVVTSEFNLNYIIEFAFNTSLSLIDGDALNGWDSAIGGQTSQRAAHDIGASTNIWDLRISNYHSSGASTEAGVKNVKIYLSDDVADYNNVFNSSVNGTLIYDGQIDQHVSSNIADWFDVPVITNGVSGRYLIIDCFDIWGAKTFMGLRAVQLREAVVIAAPTATYQTTDDEPPTNFEPATPENLTALRARTNTGNRTESRKIHLSGDAGAVWGGFSIATYVPDVTPPTNVTGAKNIDWAMWWDQSPEGPTTITRLRRTVNGTDQYLANVAGLAEWITSTPTAWWVFSRGLVTANSQSNTWGEPDITVDTIVYYAAHVDPALNNSEWVSFADQTPDYASGDDLRLGVTQNSGAIEGNLVLPTAGQIQEGVASDSNGSVIGTYSNATNPDYVISSQGGNWLDTNLVAQTVKKGIAYAIDLLGDYDPTATPDAPVLDAMTAGNGQFTAQFTAATPTDTIALLYKRSSATAWTADTQTVTGSGSITVAVGAEYNGSQFDSVVYASIGGCPSLPSNLLQVTPIDPTSLASDIVRYRIMKISDGEGGSIDIPANPLVIYPTLKYDDNQTVMTTRIEDEIQNEDIISLYGEDYYRVVSGRRNTSGLYKNWTLEKVERPTGAGPNN